MKDRRSRTGVRGGPKKGGAGGKGTWGKLTDSYATEELTKDEHDPNYNSEDEGYVVAIIQPEMTEEQFQNFFEPVVKVSTVDDVTVILIIRHVLLDMVM
jgi:programmed cell death protein 4